MHSFFFALFFATVSLASPKYDFFARARYPGPKLLKGVDLYKVEQEGGAFAEGYKRRVVHWWPRRGVDFVEVEKGMPLRVWTFRQRKELRVERDWLTSQLPSNHPLQIKAHLIGFRGIGNHYGPSGREGDYVCPAVVLRLPDGRKRCFARGTFVEEDERYILDLYMKEMSRIRKGLCKAKYEVNPSLRSQWPNNAKPLEPGTMQVASEHFVFVSGSQHPPNDPDNPWISSVNPERAKRYREGPLACAEYWWTYNEYMGNLMPCWDREQQYKYAVTVCGTYRDGYKFIPGYAGGGYGGCVLKNAGGGPWSVGLFHEWVHGHAAGRWGLVGGAEIQADAGQIIADPAILNFINNVSRPFRCCMHGSYKTCLFYAIASDDPNWGYGMALTLVSGKDESTVFHTLARLGEQRGMFENGIRGVGDMVGDFTARLAEFDCEIQYLLRQSPSPYPEEPLAVKYNWLEAVDPEKGLWRIFREEAPEPFGSNVIRLVPEPGAKEIVVDFRGIYDPKTFGDWRACICAVGASGKVRYSPLWNKGPMKMEVREGDLRFWLTVAATPWALCDASLYQGRFAPRYPYEVKLSGCRPGTPHFRPGDADDFDLVYTGGSHLCKLPYPGDSPEAKKIVPGLERREKQLRAFEAAINRELKEGKRSRDWPTRNMLRILENNKKYLHLIRDALKGRRHPNGGGWVSASSHVAPTAYVGPEAMVLDGARVLDQAVIENYALVSGPEVVICGHAKVSGRAWVRGNVKISGYTRIWHDLNGSGDKALVPPELPLRLGQNKPDKWNLWANYAMDQEEKVLLEDWFRFSPGSNRFFELNLDGTLYGEPKFVVEGERRGFLFNGKTQYAEASSMLADLGQITCVVALKWLGGSAKQVVFDFGSSLKDRFVLYASQGEGRPELLVCMGGKEEKVLSKEKLPVGKWASLRVEIDGINISLWLNGELVGRRKSEFRPCNSFPPDCVKRNFIAVSRDMKSHFHGIIDYVRIYSKVHKDFSKVPPPLLHAPRRISKYFIKYAEKQNKLLEEKKNLLNKKVRELGQYYNEMRRQIDSRIREIEESSPELEKVRKKLDQAKKKLSEARKRFSEEFVRKNQELSEKLKVLPEKIRELERKRRETFNKLLSEDKLYSELRKQEQEKRQALNKLRRETREDPEIRLAEEKLKELDGEIGKRKRGLESSSELLSLRARIRKIRRQQYKIQQRIRSTPKVRLLLDSGDIDGFYRIYGKLCSENLRLKKLKRKEERLVELYKKKLSELFDKDPLLQKLNSRKNDLEGRASQAVKISALEKELRTIGEKLANRRKEVEKGAAITKLVQEIERLRGEQGRISSLREAYIAKKIVSFQREVALAEKALSEVKEKASWAFWPEINWLRQISRAAYSGYYNVPYWRYLGTYVRSLLGLDSLGPVDDPGSLKRIYEAQAAYSWKKRCDWEWRTRWELEGSLLKFPLLRRWLDRMRDDVWIPPK